MTPINARWTPNRDLMTPRESKSAGNLPWSCSRLPSQLSHGSTADDRQHVNAFDVRLQSLQSLLDKMRIMQINIERSLQPCLAGNIEAARHRARRYKSVRIRIRPAE